MAHELRAGIALLRISGHTQDALGLGFYSAVDAARLLKMPVVNVRRWLGGYSYQRGGSSHSVPPLWEPDLPKVESKVELSFRDLIELKFVNAFVEAGLGLKTIRNCLDYARDVVENDRPFSTSRFRTDGKSIFLESIERDQPESVLLDLKKHQYAFAKVLEHSFKDLDLDGDEVTRWRPFKGKDSIVLDPQRSFGQPITAEYGVPTKALAESVVAEGSLDRVAAIYEVSLEAIRDSVRFERELQAA